MSLTARTRWSSSTTCCDPGGKCGRQGRRNSEMAATVVAPTTGAVAAASLGDFAAAAAAVKLEDVAGSRRRWAVVARGVGGAGGACVGGLAGWRSGQLECGKAVVVVMNSAGVGRNFMELYRTNRLPRTKFLWVPSGLNQCHGKDRRVGTGCEAVWASAGASEPLW